MLFEDEDRSTGSFVTTLPEYKDNANEEIISDCGGNDITCGRK
jgi:hypothetical protein